MDNLSIKGRVKYAVFSPKGKKTAEGKGNNLVTTLGKEWMGDLITGLSVVTDLNTGGEFRFGDLGTATEEDQDDLQGATIANIDPVTALQVTINKPGGVTSPEITIADDGDGLINNNGVQVQIREMGVFLGALDTPANLMIARFLPQEFLVEPAGIIRLNWTLEIG